MTVGGRGGDSCDIPLVSLFSEGGSLCAPEATSAPKSRFTDKEPQVLTGSVGDPKVPEPSLRTHGDTHIDPAYLSY
jgi:hypothetical protein